MNEKNRKKLDLGIGGITLVDKEGKEKNYPFALPPFDEMPKEIYSNHVIINHTQHEFNLFFSRMQTPITKNQFPEDGNLRLPIVAKIVIPPSLIESLIKALKDNFDKFKKTYVKKSK